MQYPLDRRGVFAAIREHFSKPDAKLAYAYGYGETFDEPETGEWADGSCVYRGEGDPKSQLRCGIGVTIPDDRYMLAMEGAAVHQLWNGLDTLDPNVPYADNPPPDPELPEAVKVCIRDLFADDVPILMLEEIQNTHDECARGGLSVSVFLRRLDKLASSYLEQHA